MAKKKKGFQPEHEHAKGVAVYVADEFKAKELDQRTLFRVINLNFFATEDELLAVYNDKKKSIVERAVAGHMAKLVKLDSLGALDYFISRICGKIPDHVIFSDNNPYSKMTIDELKKEHAKLVIENRHTFDMIAKEKELIASIDVNYKNVK